MRVLVDVCVIMEVVLKRKNFRGAGDFLKFLGNEKASGIITTEVMTNLHYLLHRATHDEKRTREILREFVNFLYVVDTTSKDCLWALDSEITDYEDGVMAETAAREEVDAIVTYNVNDFKKCVIPIFTPEEFLKKYDK